MPRQIPQYFVILRDGIRSPCLQVLQTILCEEEYRYTRNSRHECYEVVNINHMDGFQGRLTHADYYHGPDRSLSKLRYLPSQGEEPQEVKFWFTPYALETQSHGLIPLLEFQYRSWIPTGFTPISLRANLNELYETLGRIQEEMLAEIRRREDNESFRQPDVPFYHPQHRYDRPQTPPRIIETVRVVEVPVERVVVHQRILPMPKAVGDALIRDARMSKDSCPILQTPFSDCEALAVSSCFHIFDKASLATWQQAHTSCPVCRCKIETVVSE
jgi:hypothetical protein